MNMIDGLGGIQSMCLGQFENDVVILDEILSQVLPHVLLLLLIEVIDHMLEFLSGKPTTTIS